jgi:hypothetical protein
VDCKVAEFVKGLCDRQCCSVTEKQVLCVMGDEKESDLSCDRGGIRMDSKVAELVKGPCDKKCCSGTEKQVLCVMGDEKVSGF